MMTDTLPSRIYAPRVRRVRSDALPEKASYADDGCEVAPHCLECPLVRCRYDSADGQQKGIMHRFRHRVRNSLILAAASEGAKRREIAEAAQLSVRTVYRLISEAK